MIIGKNVETKKKITIDLKNLVATRLLVQSNSGGGKSWLLRRLLEQSHGKVQQIILDLEGEFSTLREKYDYLLVGREGEIPANIRTAELLAKRLLGLNVSTIIDVSELKKHERILFVKRFLDSLIDAPKKLWHPCLIIVDEAHQFAPQGTKSESTGSVIDLMTRGRKRGFCGVLATQRISKLHKDAAAECNNKLIGRTGLDIDRKRASEELGFTSKEDERSLRYLEPGEFYAFGSSISREIIKVKIGDVKTTHPEAGSQIIKSSPTPSNIKKMLKDFIDLPKEVEEELRTKEDMRKKINELNREVRILQHSKPKLEIDEKSLERAREQGFKEAEREYSDSLKKDKLALDKLRKGIEQITINCSKLLQIEIPKLNLESIKSRNHIKFKPPIKSRISMDIQTKELPRENLGILSLRAGAMKMLGWLASSHPIPLSKQRIATLSGFSVKGGTFNTYLSELKRNGWIVGNGDLSITEEGLDKAPLNQEMPTGDELLNLWCSKFRQGARKILRLVYEKYPSSISKEDIGYETGFEPSGGTFNTYLSELRRNNLIKIEGNEVTVSSEFFE